MRTVRATTGVVRELELVLGPTTRLRPGPKLAEVPGHGAPQPGGARWRCWAGPGPERRIDLADGGHVAGPASRLSSGAGVPPGSMSYADDWLVYGPARRSLDQGLLQASPPGLGPRPPFWGLLLSCPISAAAAPSAFVSDSGPPVTPRSSTAPGGFSRTSTVVYSGIDRRDFPLRPRARAQDRGNWRLPLRWAASTPAREIDTVIRGARAASPAEAGARGHRIGGPEATSAKLGGPLASSLDTRGAG